MTPIGQQFFGFAGDAIAEAKKVVWPTRKETVQTTIIVFILVIIVAVFLALVDSAFAYMIKWLLGRGA